MTSWTVTMLIGTEKKLVRTLTLVSDGPGSYVTIYCVEVSQVEKISKESSSTNYMVELSSF